MNEKLCDQILEYMKSTGDFVIKEMPEVIQQALTYHWYTNLLGLSIYMSLFTISMGILIYFLTHIELTQFGDWSTFSCGSCLISGMISFVLFMAICCCADNLIKISSAPKYFIISLFTEKKS
jgi:hypothetical protein